MTSKISCNDCKQPKSNVKSNNDENNNDEKMLVSVRDWKQYDWISMIQNQLQNNNGKTIKTSLDFSEIMSRNGVPKTAIENISKILSHPKVELDCFYVENCVAGSYPFREVLPIAVHSCKHVSLRGNGYYSSTEFTDCLDEELFWKAFAMSLPPSKKVYENMRKCSSASKLEQLSLYLVSRESLAFSMAQIQDKLQYIPNLEMLILDNCRFYNEGDDIGDVIDANFHTFIDGIRNCANLKMLSIHHCFLTNPQMNYLVDCFSSMTSLTTLELRVTLPDDDGSSNNSPIIALPPTSSLKSLSNLVFGIYGKFRLFIPWINSMKQTLTHIRFDYSTLVDNDIPYLVEFLNGNDKLQVLDISENYITDVGAIELSQCLANTTKITTLNMSRSYAMGRKGLTALVTAVEPFRRLNVRSGGLPICSTHDELERISFDYDRRHFGFRECFSEQRFGSGLWPMILERASLHDHQYTNKSFGFRGFDVDLKQRKVNVLYYMLREGVITQLRSK